MKSSKHLHFIHVRKRTFKYFGDLLSKMVKGEITLNIRKSSYIVGVLFLLAAVTAVIGVLLYGPLKYGSDYLIDGAEHGNQIVLGALMELVLVVSAIGTATTMYPILRKYNETIALWHVCFRFMEAVILTIGVISMLALLSLSREFVASGAIDTTTYHSAGVVLRSIHDWCLLLGANFMLGINTIMYSYIFFKTKLVPRFISILGITGSILVFSAALLEMFGVFSQFSVWGALFAIPVAANEMILAVWLLIKGFNEISYKMK